MSIGICTLKGRVRYLYAEREGKLGKANGMNRAGEGLTRAKIYEVWHKWSVGQWLCEWYRLYSLYVRIRKNRKMGSRRVLFSVVHLPVSPSDPEGTSAARQQRRAPSPSPPNSCQVPGDQGRSPMSTTERGIQWRRDSESWDRRGESRLGGDS